MTCKHECGWVIVDRICDDQDDVIVEVECNNPDCEKRMFRKVDISKSRQLDYNEIRDFICRGYPLDDKGFVKIKK